MVFTLPVQRPAYVLGSSNDELTRLIDQARFVGDLTAQVLHHAGLSEGMQVLDVGCGAGDVSFLAASTLGTSGMVTGVDKSPEAVDLATRRAVAAGLTNLQFVTQDLLDLVLDEPVDAIVGRLVLMYFADPAVVLRRLTRFLRPGGIVAFHEMDMSGAKSEPICPLFESTVQRIRDTFVRVGADTRAGLRLGGIFEEAGLPAPQLLLGARVERGADLPIYDQVAQITRTLAPLMERTGVASAEELDIATLAARLRDEAVARDATLVSPSFIGAFARKAISPSDAN